MSRYLYTYNPGDEFGQSGVFDWIWKAAKTVINTVVPYGGLITTGADLIVDAVTPDNPKPKKIGSLVVDAEGKAQEVIEENPPEQVDIPDVAAWFGLLQGQQQINNSVAHAFSVSQMGAFSPEEIRFRNLVEHKIRLYLISRGLINDYSIRDYGHMRAIRNPQGGMTPLGFTNPEGGWISFDEAFARSMTTGLAEFRRQMALSVAAIQQTQGSQRSPVFSTDTPEGEIVASYRDPKAAGGSSNLLLLGAVGVGAYLLLKGNKKGKRSKDVGKL